MPLYKGSIISHCLKNMTIAIITVSNMTLSANFIVCAIQIPHQQNRYNIVLLQIEGIQSIRGFILVNIIFLYWGHHEKLIIQWVLILGKGILL